VSKFSVNVESFKPLRSNTLFGFADILIPELHLRIREATVHESYGKRWVGLPANPQIGGEGSLRRDERGKIAYSAILQFTEGATRDAFSQRAITFGGGLPETAAPALSALPSAPTATKEAPNRSATTDKPSGFRTVEPPALEEETGD
jgi:hypothetical protein